MAANEAAIEMRRSAKQREVEEVESILAYQAMKVGKRWVDKPIYWFPKIPQEHAMIPRDKEQSLL